MIPLPRSPHYTSSAYIADCEMPCAVCGKAVRNPKHWLRLVNGGSDVGTAAEGDANPSADLGYYPVGANCLRQHPELKPYATDAATEVVNR